MRLVVSFLIAFAALTYPVASLAQQPELREVAKVKAASAVSGFPELGYYFLTEENAVYRYLASDSGLQFSNRFSLQPPGDAIDLILLHLDHDDSILVTQWADKLKLGSLIRYSPDGKVIGSWTTRHIPRGVTFDPVSRVVYFVTADSHELYKADLRGGEPQFVCEVRGARGLGPVALDVDRHLMYVADDQGAIFVVDLQSKKVTQLGSSVGVASALLFNSNQHVLYVADYVEGKIYAVDTSTPAPRPRIIAESRQLTAPSGLAPGKGETLLVTDSKSGGVFIVPIASSATGTPRASKSAKRKVP
jgi:hypothetical protein